MRAKKSVINTFFINMIVVILITIVILAYFMISNEYKRFNKQYQNYKSEFIESKKSMIKNDVNVVVSNIYHRKRQLEGADNIKTDAVKKDILEWTGKIRLRENQYIVVNTFDGIILSHYKSKNIGKNMWNFTDKNGVKAVQEMIKVSKNKDGGYVSYIGSIRPSTGKPGKKITYAKSIPDWNWVVLTGVYLDDIEIVATQKQNQLDENLKRFFVKIILVLCFAILISLLITRYTAIKLKANFSALDSFFSNAATNSIKIDPKKLFFSEFENMALSVNQMTAKRNQAEEALLESEQFIISVFESIQDGISVLNPDLSIRHVNGVMKKWYSENLPLEGKKCFECYHNANRPCDPCPTLRCLESGNTEMNIVSGLPDSDVEWIELYSYPIRCAETGKITRIVEFVRDITERKQAEEKLKASETFLNAIVENIPNMIFVKDAEDLRFVRFNRAGEDLLGYFREELIGKNDYDFFPKEEADFFTGKDREVLDKGTLLDIPEEPIQTKYKGERILHTKKIPLLTEKGQPEYLLGISEDITDRKRLEEQLMQAQKMESIGTLAGGIAHDFNNVLYSIIGYTELTMDDVPEGSLAQKNLKEVFKGAMRAKDMVKQILAFSRKADTQKKPVKVQSVVKEAIKLLKTSIPTTIEIRQNIDADCGPVMADPTQIHQVVMNLATNAYHAMREKGGVLTINVAKEKISIDDSASYLNLHPGTYIKLTVSDTGHGMDKAVVEKIFDPYFTTKPVGEGTGMGLSTIHGIVKSHGGHIKVYSEPGKGTVFHVYFPLIETKPVEPEIVSTGPVQKGSESILLVDDEEQIISMVKQLLERMGYQVATRASSVDALEAFRAVPDKYDLVITDMTMPNMTGVELAPRLLEIRSDIPIILCTGFSEITDENKAKALGIREFIMKPVVRDEIARTIRKVLDEGKEK